MVEGRWLVDGTKAPHLRTEQDDKHPDTCGFFDYLHAFIYNLFHWLFKVCLYSSIHLSTFWYQRPNCYTAMPVLVIYSWTDAVADKIHLFTLSQAAASMFLLFLWFSFSLGLCVNHQILHSIVPSHMGSPHYGAKKPQKMAQLWLCMPQGLCHNINLAWVKQKKMN